jgi:hypothetical protein
VEAGYFDRCTIDQVLTTGQKAFWVLTERPLGTRPAKSSVRRSPKVQLDAQTGVAL